LAEARIVTVMMNRKTGLSPGRVIFRNLCHGFAPSTLAAS
jgi:hypothetical protein